jgi:hypothetical protein
MLHHNPGAEHALPLSPDDELGRLIRWSLGRSFGNADPSEECWTSILRRVEQERAREARQCRGGPALRALTPLVQAVVISTLLLTFAASLNRDVPIPHSDLGRHPVSTSRRRSSLPDFQDGILRGSVLQRMAREKVVSAAGNVLEFAELR